MACHTCGGHHTPISGCPTTVQITSNCGVCSRSLSDGHLCFKPIVNQQSWPINPWPGGTAEIIAALKEIATELKGIRSVLRSK